MEEPSSLDEIDQSILRILSAYGQLTALQVWYELGEDDTVKEAVAEGEIRSRLESLMEKGFVERTTDPRADRDSAPLIYRVRGSDDIAGNDWPSKGTND